MKQTGCLLCCLLLLFCAGCSFTPPGAATSSGESRRESRLEESDAGGSRSDEATSNVEAVPQPTDGMPPVIDGEEVGVDPGKKSGSKSRSGSSSRKASQKGKRTGESSKATENDDKSVSQTRYIGNRNSKIFHKPDCFALKRAKAKNMRSFSTRAEAVEAGFRACSQCRP